MSRAGHVLVVDDEACSRQLMSAFLSEAGYSTEMAADGVEALAAMERELPDLVITDLRMPRMDGLELIKAASRLWPGLPCIMVTVVEDIETVVRAIRLGAVNYLIKPGTPRSVVAAVEKALRARRPPASTGTPAQEIVGESRAIAEVRHRIQLAARSDVNVLITGSTGTGKELVARAIHRVSCADRGRFVSVNCAAVPGELFESTFFGHVRGAFTGAGSDSKGLLDEADGGILFLDELESLVPAFQAKLLRALDDGEVRPVGSHDVHQVRVRTLAATNVSLDELRPKGLLRDDFYYRLRGLEIHLPDLDRRREDILPLATHFDADSPWGWTGEAGNHLIRRRWPGNVRELEQAVRTARCLAGDAPIEVEHLPPGPLVEPAAEESAGEPLLDELSLRRLERSAIIRALDQFGGNRSRAARALGIDRSTLRRKMKSLYISL